MPIELENSNDSEKRSIAAWLSGKKLDKELQKKAPEANMARTPPTFVLSKACICSPTNHVGSFRCHLHRTTGATQKPLEDNKSSSMKFGSKVINDGKPRLSRFGRAASARSPQKIKSLAVE